MHSKFVRAVFFALSAVSVLPASALADRVVIRSPVVTHRRVMHPHHREVEVRSPVRVHEDHHATRVEVH